MKKMQNKVMVLVLILAMAVGLTGCGVTIDGIAIPAMVEINEGETATIEVNYTADEANVSAEALLEAADKLALEWTSSDETVATVDADGNVTALNGGEATITVTDGNGLSATTKVSVRVPLKGFEAEASMELYINGSTEDIVASKPLVVGPIPADADDYTPVYESADENIAVVDEDGIVTAVSNGKTTITVKSGEISTEVEVTVYTVPSAFYAKDMELTVGNSGKLDVEVKGENINFGTDFTYSSSDDTVATVDKDGVVTAVGEGEAQITVQSETGVASAAIVRTTKPAATTNRGSGSTGSSGSTSNSGGSTSSSGGNATGDTGSSSGTSESESEAVETMGPTPEPAPELTPAPAPTPESAPAPAVVCTYCGGPHHVDNCPKAGTSMYKCAICGSDKHATSDCPNTNVAHYHGDGTDVGTCPACGAHYSPLIDVSLGADPDGYC